MSQIIEKYIKDDNVLNIYQFGSHLYGTAGPLSDEDYIVVAKTYFDSGNVNIQVHTKEAFERSLEFCDIQMLECVNASSEFVLKKTVDFQYNIDKGNLRKSISTISSNSYTKCKKKLIVTGDYDLRAGLKSMYHSIRILSYGIQLAECGTIYNFKENNFVLQDLTQLSDSYQRIELWNMIETKYKKYYLTLSTRFKTLAPKDPKDYNNKAKLAELLSRYDIKNDELLNEIMDLFKLHN